MRHPDFLFATTYPITFDEDRLATAALGGAETALVEMSRGLALRGCEVEVFAPAPREGLRHGVRWSRVESLRSAMERGEVRPRVFVICRDAALAPLADHADATWLWLQDMPMEGLRKVTSDAAARVDRVLCISDYQRDRFAAVHDIPEQIVAERFVRTRNGIDVTAHSDLLSAPVDRIPGRCVYASTPFRGLGPLLDAWPRICERTPTASLEILGGMASYDQSEEPFAALYDRAREMQAVVVRGPVPQAEVMAAMRRAQILVYPCTFHEAGCIVVQMAKACGAVPVTSDIACLPEYVAQCGVVVDGNPRGGGTAAAEFLDRFADEVVDLLQDEHRRAAIRAEIARHQVGWEPVVEQWLAWR